MPGWLHENEERGVLREQLMLYIGQLILDIGAWAAIGGCLIWAMAFGSLSRAPGAAGASSGTWTGVLVWGILSSVVGGAVLVFAV